LAQIRPDVDQARSQSRKTDKIASRDVARSRINWITSMPGFGCSWWRVPMPHKSYGRTAMRGKFLAITALVVSGTIATAFLVQSLSSSSAQTQARQLPEYTASGDLVLPKNFHEWIYVGSPLTPNALITP
jgi:hypothetical protein